MVLERFGKFTLDAANRVLRAGDAQVPVQPKVFECIELLVSEAGQLVTRKRLHQALWPGVNVGDAALRRVIREARRALGDGGEQGLIRTRRKLGYVFSGTVVREPLHDGLMAAVAVPNWPFVGREAELARLSGAVAGAESGAGAFCFLSGEAGAGKSTLLSELRKRIAPGPAQWVAGHCSSDSGAPAFWPWREIAAELVARTDVRAGIEESALARVIPELSALAKGERSEPPADAEQRFLACEAYVRWLKRLTVSAPLFIVLEDVHWADEGSVLLLESLGRAIRQHPLFVFVSYRPDEVAPGQALSKLLSRTSDREGTLGVHLNALGVDEIQALLTRLRCSELATGTPRMLQQLTGGNPLFIRQIVTHSLGSGAHGTSSRPATLGHVVSERVSSLPPAALRLLRMAAVLGSGASIAALGDLARLTAEPLKRALAPAFAASILVLSEDSERLEFSHELLREALYRGLPPELRYEYHAAALGAREAGAVAPDQSHALALHAFLAGPWVEAARKRELCERAGREAFEMLAFDRAVLHLARALELLEEAAPARAKAELALLLARARWEADEPSEVVRSTFLEAAAHARDAGSAALLGQAALGCFIGEGSLPMLRWRRIPSQEIALLEEALQALESEEPGLPCGGLKYWLARTLSTIHLGEGHRTAALATLEVVVKYAEPERDGWTRGLSISVRHAGAVLRGDAELARSCIPPLEACMDDPSLNGRQRIELGLRLLAFSLGSGELGTFERAGARIERAVEAMPAAPRIGRFGERLAVYTIVPKVARVTVALIRGEFARAEVLMIATGELGERIGTLRARDGDENEFLMWLQLRGYQGRASELEPLLEARLEKFPDDHWEAAVAKAQFALERGELERAKQQYRLLSVTRFQVPREGRLLPAKLATRVRMADLCAAIGSSKDALALYEGLLPDAGSCVSHGALISFGSIARPLGELAHKLGNYERAASHFERALETNLRFGHRPEVVRTRLGLARTLCALGRFDEAELESAAAYADAESMGMAPCSELARELSPLRSSR